MIGNVGDSRAMIIRGNDGTCESLSADHHPLLPREQKRILSAGGMIDDERVDGELAMSRAIGILIIYSLPECTWVDIHMYMQTYLYDFKRTK